MYKLIKSALMTVILVATFSGCTKKESDTPIPTKTEGKHASSRLDCAQIAWETGNYGSGGVMNTFIIGHFNPANDCYLKPTPLIIAFHGGGFTSGLLTDVMPDKLGLYLSSDPNVFTPILPPENLISNGIAYATASYRFADETNNTTIRNSLDDCKKFVKYMKDNAAQYNIDPDNIILLGFSAGASSALWVGLQDPSIKGIIAHSPQATMDITAWRNQVFAPFGQQGYCDSNIVAVLGNANLGCKCNYLKALYGTDQPAAIKLFANANNLNTTNLIDAGDPELFLMTDSKTNNYGPLLHDPCHIFTLKSKANSVGLKCRVYTPTYYYNPGNETVTQFCKRRFGII